MTLIIAKQALLPDGWHRDVQVTVDDDGRISAIKHGQSEVSKQSIQVGVLLPAPVNVHKASTLNEVGIYSRPPLSFHLRK